MDGIVKAKEKGTKSVAQATPDVVADIRRMRSKGLMIREIMEKVGLSKASVYRALGREDSETAEAGE